MARRRKELGEAVEAQIVALMNRGGTAESIAAATGTSRATIGRRMRELRGKAGSARQRATVPPLPPSPEAIPKDADVGTFDVWLEDAKRHADAAEAEGNLKAFAEMGRLSVSLLEARRKATPVPKEDPNERPDMIAAKERGRAALLELIDQAVGT